MTEHPQDGAFFIDEAIGISEQEFQEIVADIQLLEESDMNMVDVVKEAVKGRNPRDVMVGLRLALLLYKNEGRL